MAAKAKSSPVLVVFLVIFILLSVILGVTTYLGFSGQSDLDNAAKKAKEDEGKANKDKDWYQLLAISYKSYLGLPLTKTEQENIVTLRSGFNSGTIVTSSRAPDKDENVKAIRENLDKPLGWDATTNRPQKSYTDMVEDLKKKLDAATKNWETAKEGEKKARADADANKKELENAKTAFADALDKLKKQADADLAKYVQTIAERDKEKGELGQKIEELKTEMASREGQTTKKVQAMEKESKQLKQAAEKLAEKVNAKVNILDYDHPKGKIYQVDQTGRMPYINLGSADNLKPGVTFSVYAAGPDGRPISFDVTGPDGKPVLGPDNKPEKEGKATVEVVNILGAHVAQVRTTWIRDEGRDPIQRGDLLFNPGWDPNARQHVAVTGLIDLTGEGRDDMNEFIRNLQQQGVIVDAYLDLKDITVKGKGIDRQTDYLILGPVPDFAGSDQAKEDDPRVKHRAAIIKEMTDMQQKAIDNGVTLISLRKFLALAGYRVPRGAGLKTGAENARPPALSGGAPPAAKEKDKEAPKEKDKDMEKDK
jgi:hypothetical protein